MTAGRPVTRIPIYMTGSEWFESAPGGLPRYFGDLFAALRSRTDTDVAAIAFGSPEFGGQSWGESAGSTLSRVRRSRRPATPTRGTIIDRHFALYGPAPRFPRSKHHRTVTHFHGPWAAESAASGASSATVSAKRMIEATRYRTSDAVVVLSNAFRDVLVSDYRVDQSTVHVIAPGVDLDRFPVPENAIDSEHPLVLCVRRLEHRMGIDTLIAAWPAVLDQFPRARLMIVGTGTVEAELRRDAGSLPSVTFTGRVSDEVLADLYRQATVSVIPTRSLEGFGLIALESLASGRAPVVTNVGGLPDSVITLDPTLVVPPNAPEPLAARISRALQGDLPDAAACRTHAALFSWQAAADAHMRLYRQLLR